jgi:RNA polymerase sigma-70 factor (ECF subfamily)
MGGYRMTGERHDCGPDLDLARRALSGDGSAWQEIVDGSCDRLFGFLYYQTGEREEALDLLQETYLAAFRRLRDYRGEAPIGAWLRVIALRKAIDWKRTVLRRLRKTIELRDSAGSVDPSGEHAVHFDSERSALYGALASLSPLQRAVFLLREWEEWSFAEIARAIGCGEGTARVHYTRARRQLRKRIRTAFPAAFAPDGMEGHKR